MVPPDLDATSTSVWRGSHCAATARTEAGEVSSSTVSGRPPARTPNTRISTSGARLEPPIPRSSTRV